MEKNCLGSLDSPPPPSLSLSLSLCPTAWRFPRKIKKGHQNHRTRDSSLSRNISKHFSHDTRQQFGCCSRLPEPGSTIASTSSLREPASRPTPKPTTTKAQYR